MQTECNLGPLFLFLHLSTSQHHFLHSRTISKTSFDRYSNCLLCHQLNQPPTPTPTNVNVDPSNKTNQKWLLPTTRRLSPCSTSAETAVSLLTASVICCAPAVRTLPSLRSRTSRRMSVVNSTSRHSSVF